MYKACHDRAHFVVRRNYHKTSVKANLFVCVKLANLGLVLAGPRDTIPVNAGEKARFPTQLCRSVALCLPVFHSSPQVRSILVHRPDLF